MKLNKKQKTAIDKRVQVARQEAYDHAYDRGFKDGQTETLKQHSNDTDRAKRQAVNQLISSYAQMMEACARSMITLSGEGTLHTPSK